MVTLKQYLISGSIILASIGLSFIMITFGHNFGLTSPAAAGPSPGECSVRTPPWAAGASDRARTLYDKYGCSIRAHGLVRAIFNIIEPDHRKVISPDGRRDIIDQICQTDGHVRDGYETKTPKQKSDAEESVSASENNPVSSDNGTMVTDILPPSDIGENCQFQHREPPSVYDWMLSVLRSWFAIDKVDEMEQGDPEKPHCDQDNDQTDEEELIDECSQLEIDMATEFDTRDELQMYLKDNYFCQWAVFIRDRLYPETPDGDDRGDLEEVGQGDPSFAKDELRQDEPSRNCSRIDRMYQQLVAGNEKLATNSYFCQQASMWSITVVVMTLIVTIFCVLSYKTFKNIRRYASRPRDVLRRDSRRPYELPSGQFGSWEMKPDAATLRYEVSRRIGVSTASNDVAEDVKEDNISRETPVSPRATEDIAEECEIAESSGEVLINMVQDTGVASDVEPKDAQEQVVQIKDVQSSTVKPEAEVLVDDRKDIDVPLKTCTPMQSSTEMVNDSGAASERKNDQQKIDKSKKVDVEYKTEAVATDGKDLDVRPKTPKQLPPGKGKKDPSADEISDLPKKLRDMQAIASIQGITSLKEATPYSDVISSLVPLTPNLSALSSTSDSDSSAHFNRNKIQNSDRTRPSCVRSENSKILATSRGSKENDDLYFPIKLSLPVHQSAIDNSELISLQKLLLSLPVKNSSIWLHGSIETLTPSSDCNINSVSEPDVPGGAAAASKPETGKASEAKAVGQEQQTTSKTWEKFVSEQDRLREDMIIQQQNLVVDGLATITNMITTTCKNLRTETLGLQSLQNVHPLNKDLEAANIQIILSFSAQIQAVNRLMVKQERVLYSILDETTAPLRKSAKADAIQTKMMDIVKMYMDSNGIILEINSEIQRIKHRIILRCMESMGKTHELETALLTNPERRPSKTERRRSDKKDRLYKTGHRKTSGHRDSNGTQSSKIPRFQGKTRESKGSSATAKPVPADARSNIIRIGTKRNTETKNPASNGTQLSKIPRLYGKITGSKEPSASAKPTATNVRSRIARIETTPAKCKTLAKNPDGCATGLSKIPRFHGRITESKDTADKQMPADVRCKVPIKETNPAKWNIARPSPQEPEDDAASSSNLIFRDQSYGWNTSLARSFPVSLRHGSKQASNENTPQGRSRSPTSDEEDLERAEDNAESCQPAPLRKEEHFQ